MFAGGFIPAIIFFVGLFFIPKSPSYAHSKGKEDLARSILKKLKRRNTGEKNISHGMKDESDYSMKSWRSIFCKENKISNDCRSWNKYFTTDYRNKYSYIFCSFYF